MPLASAVGGTMRPGPVPRESSESVSLELPGVPAGPEARKADGVRQQLLSHACFS
jgi:hypothetical protein